MAQGREKSTTVRGGTEQPCREKEREKGRADCRTWRRQAGHGAPLETGRLITDSLFLSGRGITTSTKTAGP